MKKLLIGALAALLTAYSPARAADNIVINQANGQFAIIKTTESSNIHTLNVSCTNCASGITIGTTTITGGADTQVLYNRAGTVGSDAGLTYNETTDRLTSLGGLTVTQGQANTSILSTTGYSLTGSSDVSLIDLAGTLNTSGNPDVIKLAITKTATGGGVNYLRILGGAAGATFLFKIDEYGNTYTADHFAVGNTGAVGFFGASAVMTRNQGGTGYGFHATNASSLPDIAANSFAAGVLTVTNGLTGGGALEFIEQTAPAAPAADAVRLYAVDVAGESTLTLLGGSLSIGGKIASSSSTGGVGYSTGAGGTVTQATDRTTTVVLNKVTGQVTTTNTSLAAITIVTFTVTNSTVAATDTIILSKVSGDIDTSAWVSAVAAGSFNVSLRNNDAINADTTAFVFNFTVIKGVTS